MLKSKYIGIVFFTAVFLVLSTVPVYACTATDQCASYCTRAGEVVPDCSYTCDGVLTDPITGLIIEGSCKVTMEDGCSSWGGWSTCTNYCKTRSCPYLPYYQIVSCDGGICGDATTTVCSDRCIATPVDTTIETLSCPADTTRYGVLFNTYDTVADYNGSDMHVGDRWTCGPSTTKPLYYNSVTNDCNGSLVYPYCLDGRTWYDRSAANQYFYAPVAGDYEFYISGTRGNFTKFSMDVNMNGTIDCTRTGSWADQYVNISVEYPTADGCCRNSRPCYYSCPLEGRCTAGVNCGVPCSSTSTRETCWTQDDNASYSAWNGDSIPNYSTSYSDMFTAPNFQYRRTSRTDECIIYANEYYNTRMWSKVTLAVGYHKFFYQGPGNFYFRFPANSGPVYRPNNNWIQPGTASSIPGGCPFRACNCTCGTPSVLSTVGSVPLAQEVLPEGVVSFDFPDETAWSEECGSPSTARRYQVCVSTTSSATTCSTTPLTSTTSSASTSLTSGHYYWKTRAMNACGNYSAWSAERQFDVNSAPEIIEIEIINIGDTVINTEIGETIPYDIGGTIVADVSNMNQICDPDLGGDRQIGAAITVSDTNGVSSLASVIISHTNLVGGTETHVVTGAELNAVGNTTTVYYAERFGNEYDGRDVTFQVNVIDGTNQSTGWQTVRIIHMWDCMVDISGTMYDASDTGIVCPSGTGYTTEAAADLNFTQAIFAVGTTNYTANANNPPTNSRYGVLSVPWGYWYLSSVNSDLNGSSPTARWQGNGNVLCGNGQTLDGNFADPYANNPTITVDFASVRNQDPWYSALGGGIVATGVINDLVPATCATDMSCIPAISGSWLNNTNGVVSAGRQINGVCQDNCSVASPNDTYIENINTLGQRYGYDYFYNHIFGTLNTGTTLGNGTSMLLSEVLSSANRGVVFIDGDLDVDTDLVIPTGEYFMAIVNGDILVENDVNQLQGVFVSNNFDVELNDGSDGGTNDNQLQIGGSIYARGDVNLYRDFPTSSNNNTMPSVAVYYRPDFLFFIPGDVANELSNWRETSN